MLQYYGNGRCKCDVELRRWREKCDIQIGYEMLLLPLQKGLASKIILFEIKTNHMF